ncbi:MAG: hypothetical protein N2235_08450 [Fischerella sp.]|nr:hypothetical protein [Fischerella sp.]
MATYAEYFELHRPKPKFQIGDRVQGFFNDMPIRGTVLIEHIVNEEQGAKVHVWLDLPIRYNNSYSQFITCQPKILKPLK